MQWFTLQGIMFHTDNNIRSPADHLQSLLKVFLMFKIWIWYDDIIVHEDVPYSVEIMCINCGKKNGC